MNNLPTWWPKREPIYHIEKSYRENLEHGPFFEGSLPNRVFPSKNAWKDFLGFSVASTLGVPAGPLLNANWVAFAAKMGFDILTYKTIRSHSHQAHSLPNIVYVDTKGPLTQERNIETVATTKTPPDNLKELAATNSFGIPSQDAAYLASDIAKANNAIQEGQVLIVSIVGASIPDFIKTAHIACASGAKLIEVDLSCPNLGSGEGMLYADPDAISQIVSPLKKSIGSSPLIIKIGVIPEKERLRQVMIAAAKAGVDAICGINTVSMKIIQADGTPALGENRIRAGVCGGPIQPRALDYIRHARAINNEEKLDMTLMGTGGVTHPEHFDLFFEAGADVAMSAIGMIYDPYLAMRYHEQKT